MLINKLWKTDEGQAIMTFLNNVSLQGTNFLD
jgi:hypothetical protein